MPLQHSLITTPLWQLRSARCIAALLAGVFLTAAFAPLNCPLLALFCPVLLLWGLRDARPRQAWWRGTLFGIGFFGCGVSWIFVSIHSFSITPTYLAILLTAVFILYLAQFSALACSTAIGLFPRDDQARALVGLPVLWVCCEWLRSTGNTGFPWLLLGHSQSDTSLQGLIPIVGIYGVSFILFLLAGCLYRFLRSRQYLGFLWLLPALVVWLCAAKLTHYPWTTTTGKSIPVAIVQGNIAQPIKWDSNYLFDSLQRYKQLTEPLLNHNIVVWPETAIATDLDNATPFVSAIHSLAKAKQATVITGVPVRASNSGDFYNGVMALGIGEGRYYKRNAVPFGEYLPFRDYLWWLSWYFDVPSADTIPGPWEQENLTSHGIQIAPLVCYEIAFSETVRHALPKANLLVTVLNDDWFGHSLAPAQHAQIARIQSLQTGRYQVLAANTGVSNIIDANGQVLAQAPQFRTEVLKGTVLAMQGSTPWVWYGNTPILLCLLLLLGLTMALRYQTVAVTNVWEYP